MQAGAGARVSTPSPPSRSAQKSSVSSDPTRQMRRVHHPVARAAARRARVLEERDVRAGGPVLVRVEQVVDGRVVLVDRLLDHPQAEHPHVEVDVARRVARDAGDVVDPLDLHGSRLAAAPGPADI